MEAVSVHLRKVDRRVLTRRCEDYHGQEVDKLLTVVEGFGEAFIYTSTTHGRVSVVMEITGPILKFVVLKNNKVGNKKHVEL